MARMYAPSWTKLKEKLVIVAEVTTSDSEKVIKAHASTYTRAIQKEKYLDTIFRRKYPDATLTSTTDYKLRRVRIVLVLNDSSLDLKEL